MLNATSGKLSLPGADEIPLQKSKRRRSCSRFWDLGAADADRCTGGKGQRPHCCVAEQRDGDDHRLVVRHATARARSTRHHQRSQVQGRKQGRRRVVTRSHPPFLPPPDAGGDRILKELTALGSFRSMSALCLSLDFCVLSTSSL